MWVIIHIITLILRVLSSQSTVTFVQSPIFPEGKEIDDHNFLNRAWRGYKNRHGNQVEGIVTRLFKEGAVSEYRSQYNTRHTFITQCLEAGITVVQVAKWVGNTPEIILKHYAGTTLHIQVPEL
jgi:integrase